MLDVLPEDPELFGHVGRRWSALARTGLATQSEIRSHPGPWDRCERINIKAPAAAAEETAAPLRAVDGNASVYRTGRLGAPGHLHAAEGRQGVAPLLRCQTM